MSVNQSRRKLRAAECSKDYRLIWLKVEYPMYWEEGLNFIKGHPSCKYRSYKTWKHNRKTQYK